MRDVQTNYAERYAGLRIAVLWQMKGTYRGAPDFGPLTHQPVDLMGISQFLVQDGRIVREIRVYDQIGLRAQINNTRGDGLVDQRQHLLTDDAYAVARIHPHDERTAHPGQHEPDNRDSRRGASPNDPPQRLGAVQGGVHRLPDPRFGPEGQLLLHRSGVSQSTQQFVNLTEPHGFSLGAAGMPRGTTNSLHLHFTAEVFINFGGEFRLRWGADGSQGEYVSTDGDVISVPTWIFRGFTNEGPDDGILLPSWAVTTRAGSSGARRC